ncbi:unnamed protein product [Dicrocoelium dendriticum]|nr:unnamed protein product [Dicrocoelium dendriticum]
MSLSPVQSESVQLLGVLHGTISATHLDHLLHRSGASTASGVRPSRRVYLSGESNPQLSSANIRQSFLRDKSMRRSLPRVLIHRHQSKIIKNGGNTARTCASLLAKARSEGLDLDRLNQQNQSGASQSSECDTDVKLNPAPDTNGLPGSLQQPITPPAGQASLFTLNNHLTLSGCNVPSTEAVSTTAQCQVESGTSLEQTALSKRYLLMNQSGQVISCTTLFDGDEADDDANGVGCRRLQKCTGWNFVPLFVGHERSDRYALSDEDRVADQKDPETSVHAVRSLHPGPDENEDNQSDLPGVKQTADVKLLNRLRRFLSRRIQTRRASGSQKKRKTGCLVAADTHPNISTCSNHDRQQRRQKRRRRKRIGATKVITDHSTSDCQSLSEEPCRSSETTRFHTGDTLDDTRSSGNLQIDRKHTIVSNASVFSLPAIPPEMWTVERPVWIMGVPMSSDQRWVAVDACDLIVLSKDGDRAGSVDSMKPVTGSRSSMFAFHVKPPSRLKPATRAAACTQHVRARSLGRIRLSEKYLAQH